MSPLQRASEEYLALRRAMGFKLERHGQLLEKLVAHLDAAGVQTVTTAAALEWAALPEGRPNEWAMRLQVARAFARYLHGIDKRCEVPPTGLLTRDRRRLAPHLYSERDVTAMMAATEQVICFPLRAASYRTLIGLLAVTGMRIGEAIALDDEDVDRSAGILTVRAGKWGASRQLPLHPSTLAALGDYRALRDRTWPTSRSDAFFVSAHGRRLHPGHARDTLRRLRAHAGITAAPGGREPRTHDLRHSFAVTTLVDWYRQGLDVPALLPRLSDYLGHSAPRSTYWYLQATPTLLTLAAERLECLEERS
jgi:integrase/recombinase XerD